MRRFRFGDSEMDIVLKLEKSTTTKADVILTVNGQRVMSFYTERDSSQVTGPRTYINTGLLQQMGITPIGHGIHLDGDDKC